MSEQLESQPELPRRTYMVRCDMEGASGIVHYDQVRPGVPEYEVGQRLFMSDLLALVTGLREGGADEIVIYDEHTSGRNIDLRALPDYTSAICGKPPYRKDWPGGLDSSFSGLILLGFHSMAGTTGGLMPHTYEGDIRTLKLNGVVMGEIGVETAIAGDWGVPMVLVTGDSAGVAEAAQLQPASLGVVVKDAYDSQGALCYSMSVTAALIRRAAKQVVEDPPDVPAYRLDDEVVLEVELNDGTYLDRILELYPEDCTEGRVLTIRGETATEVWADYWQRKLQARDAPR